MRMQPSCPGGHLGREHQRLAKPAHPVARPVLPEIAQERQQGSDQTWPQKAAEEGSQHAAIVIMKILGQVGHGSDDLVMHRVPLTIGRPAKRHQFQRQAGALEAKQFLRDEGFRQARIALQDDDGLLHLFARLQLSRSTTDRC